jgi:hypothetical protein
MLHDKCSLRDSVYVAVEEKVAMCLLVVGHGLKIKEMLKFVYDQQSFQQKVEIELQHFFGTELHTCMSVLGTVPVSYVVLLLLHSSGNVEG